MQGEPPTQASRPAGAVFLSYATQDAEAAKRICETLRAAGIEVWFDQSELRGGDAWDAKIRREIHDCALFIPIVSQHTQERLEGYFRHEWKLAIERAHHIAEQKPFLVPVVVDGTRDQEALVPDAFRAVQWTRLPEGETPPAVIEGIQRLLSPEASTTIRPANAQSGAVGISQAPVQASSPSLKRGLFVAVAVLVLGAIAYFAVETFRISKPSVSSPTVAASAAAVFAPPAHSIAVLPFVNMSGDKDQEYFSDGLTEELLNSLSRINELQVAARTSSFSFAGEHPDIATVAHKLNVAAVLEGSVRRSAHTIRITTQLVNGSTGFHVWSQTYDRELGDVLKLQTEIATAVARALKVTLLGNAAQKIEVGGTHNPAALDAYLRASKIYWSGSNKKDNEAAIAGYTEAIRLDPDYALAYAARSLALQNMADKWATTPSAFRAGLDKAQADADKSVALAPELSEGHLALAGIYEDGLDFTRASEEYERALTLEPGNARLLRDYGAFEAQMGRDGLTSLHRAVVLDPLNPASHVGLAQTLLLLRRYSEAIPAYKQGEALRSDEPEGYSAYIGIAYYLLGDLENARTSCEKKAEDHVGQICLAITYDKLGRHRDAEAMLAKVRASDGDTGATFYCAVYAQWGDKAQALDWLETSMRLRNSDLEWLKTLSLFDPLRDEPRFQVLLRQLKFPD